jgi:hypothetical protein
MKVTRMLDELKAERDAVDQAILVLARIATGRGKRRDHPPAWLAGAAPPLRPTRSELVLSGT